ncbi:MAG: hypothetical protein DRJ40_01805 [Thermoprotei archaeon]|nr:MAG: hypothetical protein DRJ40_01805 [Thermoprotei archaeon]
MLLGLELLTMILVHLLRLERACERFVFVLRESVFFFVRVSNELKVCPEELRWRERLIGSIVEVLKRYQACTRSRIGNFTISIPKPLCDLLSDFVMTLRLNSNGSLLTCETVGGIYRV